MYMGVAGRLTHVTFPVLTCKNQVVGEVSKFKYLSVLVDKTLKFNEHTICIKCKVFIKMKTLGTNRAFTDEKLAIHLHKSHILPHIDYADVIYYATSKTDCQTLRVMQNGCLQICYNRHQWLSCIAK